MNPQPQPTGLAPIQVPVGHFPRNAELGREFTYRDSPVFMNERDGLGYGEPQEAAIELRR